MTKSNVGDGTDIQIAWEDRQGWANGIKRLTNWHWKCQWIPPLAGQQSNFRILPWMQSSPSVFMELTCLKNHITIVEVRSSMDVLWPAGSFAWICCLPQNKHRSCWAYWVVNVFASFALCDSMQSTPHMPNFKALVERFHTVPVAPLGLPDGLLKIVAELFVGHWITIVEASSVLSQSPKGVSCLISYLAFCVFSLSIFKCIWLVIDDFF